MGTVTAGNVTFVTGRELLDDMARDLARTIIAPLQASVEIHIGMHLPRRLKPSIPPGRRDILIGMQTEQVLDENGRELWNHRYRDKILSLVDRYDYIIDVSPTNAPIYNALPEGQRAKVHIGPYIFPVRAPALAISEEAPLVFIGSLNNRRERALAWMEKNGAKIRRVPEGTFGEDLAAEVDAAGGIVNSPGNPLFPRDWLHPWSKVNITLAWKRVAQMPRPLAVSMTRWSPFSVAPLPCRTS